MTVQFLITFNKLIIELHVLTHTLMIFSVQKYINGF